MFINNQIFLLIFAVFTLSRCTGSYDKSARAPGQGDSSTKQNSAAPTPSAASGAGVNKCIIDGAYEMKTELKVNAEVFQTCTLMGVYKGGIATFTDVRVVHRSGNELAKHDHLTSKFEVTIENDGCHLKYDSVSGNFVEDGHVLAAGSGSLLVASGDNFVIEVDRKLSNGQILNRRTEMIRKK